MLRKLKKRLKNEHLKTHLSGLSSKELRVTWFHGPHHRMFLLKHSPRYRAIEKAGGNLPNNTLIVVSNISFERDYNGRIGIELI